MSEDSESTTSSQDLATSFATSITNTFVLAKADISLLRQYLDYGSSLPTTIEHYKQEYPEEILQKLLFEDPGLYSKTGNTLCGVYEHTGEFRKEGWGGVGRLAEEVHDFAQTAAATYNNLCELIKEMRINIDDTNQPNAAETAQETFNSILTSLTNRATSKERDTEEVVQTLAEFHTTTTSDETKIADIKSRFESLTQPIAKQLQEVEKRIEDTHKDLLGAEKKIRSTKISRNRSLGLLGGGLINPAFLVAGVVTATGLHVAHDRAKDDRDDTKTLWRNERQEHAGLLRANSLLETLKKPIDDVASVIGRVVHIVERVKRAFKRIAVNLKGVARDLEILEEHKLVFDLHLAAKKWEEIEKIAYQFHAESFS